MKTRLQALAQKPPAQPRTCVWVKFRQHEFNSCILVIGRTQELLYELERHYSIQNKQKPVSKTRSGTPLNWEDMDIIIWSTSSKVVSRRVYQSLGELLGCRGNNDASFAGDIH